ncbi:molybdate ABC transporter substrate-binding protein [Vibrio aquaticus]|uniref:Molybdate ABC transporter substrate-binding protein n=1 Tax=Vibrio aquaticus TaxID=2496559 RepID=A0A3S0P803_9VIBR|nr:molybdate ABC transporter substrate-binding protein [Vibrio aquaticus]RTZ17317.1 molybdate ABC transporter substrate-binding protein [Vibrio aquaticus]
MKRRHLIQFLTLLLMSSSSFGQESIRVYAASSMTQALQALSTQFEREHDVKVTLIFAGTSSLARQIEQGAPADIFIAANQKWMDYLLSKEAIDSDAVTIVASNQLVVVGQQATHLETANAQSWLDTLDGQRLALGQTNAVPAGIYAKQSLQALGVWSNLAGQLAPTKNVRTVLALVERNESPLGIVYLTDALSSDKVHLVGRLPESTHDAIVYPMTTLNEKEATQAFSQFVRSPHGQAILQQYGFKKVHEN